MREEGGRAALHPSSLIPHPSSLILIPHPSSLIPHPSSLIPHPSSRSPRHRFTFTLSQHHHLIHRLSGKGLGRSVRPDDLDGLDTLRPSQAEVGRTGRCCKGN